MSQHIARAQLLLQRRRFHDAETELKQAIALDSEDGYARALLALVLSAQQQHQEALSEAKVATARAPASPFCRYALAAVLYGLEQYTDAQKTIEEALRLDPADPRHYELLSRIHLQKQEWQHALEAADHGLALNSEDVDLNNLRAIALVRLGRREEAGQTLDFALSREPENATTHANQGWALLHRGNVREAMAHFREALRLNPEHTWAKQGIVEALKARNPIYRVMLAYFLWMSRLSPNTRWAIVIGAYMLSRLARTLSLSVPTLAPIMTPVLILYGAFVFLSWTAAPLFNLALRLHPIGRFALSAVQRTASNWVGMCLLVALATVVSGLALGIPALVSGALIPVALVLPVAGAFAPHRSKQRRTLLIVTGVLALVGLGSIAAALTAQPYTATLQTIFWFGILGYQMLANALINRRPS